MSKVQKKGETRKALPTNKGRKEDPKKKTKKEEKKPEPKPELETEKELMLKAE